jgi:nitroimidazol reductase NimA-like FMN-containing flavoprotein (pyridoxamine 5'-phosphate oxidase superfamily)
MPSRRDLIRMSDEEALAYLRSQCKAVLGTIGKDGMPHLVTLYYGVDPEGCIVLTSFAKAQKVLNVERDPRATLCVESGDSYHEIKSVMAQCSAEVIRDYEPMRTSARPMRDRRRLKHGNRLPLPIPSALSSA